MRYTYLLDKYVTHHMHVMFVGPTGTGKTAYIKRHLQQGLDPAAFTSMNMTFSAQTSANMTQVCALRVCHVAGLVGWLVECAGAREVGRAAVRQAAGAEGAWGRCGRH